MAVPGPVAARDIALAVGREAAALLQRGWGHAGRIDRKVNAWDLVTEWDTRVEQLVAERLARATPGVPLLGEEGGVRAGSAPARWLVDPVDGTVNFAHGFPLFSISIGYEREGRLEAGVVMAPALGWEFAAARGAGATLSGERLEVSSVTELERAMLVTGFPVDRAVSPRNNFKEFEHFQLKAGAVRRLGSASLDLCFVARGWIDGYWEYKLKPWDLAAGALIVEEAGGRVTGIRGEPFDVDRGECVASNGRIHDQIVAELRGFA